MLRQSLMHNFNIVLGGVAVHNNNHNFPYHITMNLIPTAFTRSATGCSNAAFELIFWSGAFRSQNARLAQINMDDLIGAAGCVPVEQHANALCKAAGNSDLVQREQRSVEPAEF